MSTSGQLTIAAHLLVGVVATGAAVGLTAILGFPIDAPTVLVTIAVVGLVTAYGIWKSAQ